MRGIADKYVIDRHKIMFHPERLASWLKARDNWAEAKKVYPIYVEFSSSGLCNHRCKFCALDYLGYNSGLADFENLKRAIGDMAKGGVKSIQFGGEGEPLLHPKIKEIVRHTKSLGIDVSFTTNGTLLKEGLLRDILPLVTWIKVSLDAGLAATHMKIHRPKIQDFDAIMDNLKKAVEIRRVTKAKCTLGGQMLLLPDNHKEAVILAKKLKEIGLDYLVIKPYSQHKKSITREYENISYKKYFYLAKELKKLNSGKFQVIFRENTMEKLEAGRDYETCHAVPFFWAYLMANGDVYTCSSFLGDGEFKLGNYNKESFKEIWEGAKRKKHWKFIRTKFDINQCRKNCRMDEANGYLERLINPPEHVNFI
ncbi:MAG: radical SAM protein [Candidatus Wildermuthbacteria bacterium]|nr:radical SAM protein [Candidatus Wildermuthbacteria bacterium]